ncbi:MAG: hypothetical protein IKS93_04395, partial [Methanobrevibacter sp.]|nr:hypothetical protein [Methanobrevibacter sp.]
MPEKCKLYNLESFTDEERQRVEDLINQIKEEKKAQKWWVMPKYPVFSKEVRMFGQSYVVEPQKEFYTRSKPPLKTDFESKEAAEKWLNNYLAEDDLFKKAIDEIKYLEHRLDKLLTNLHNHRYISITDIHDCFES